MIPILITVGADCEVPLTLGDGTFFPVTGIVGGTKKKPRALGRPGFFVQEDNVNLEFNIPAATDGLTFEQNIRQALKLCRAALPSTMELQIVATAEYKPEFLNMAPECLVFGCTPDFNVYTREENAMPAAKNPCLRSASGHIHVGWKNPSNEDRLDLVKMLDITLGLQWLHRDSIKRRELYGKAGAFRPKEYGVEYRVLGNFWLEEGFPRRMFLGVKNAVTLVNQKFKLTADQEAAVIKAINTGVTTQLSNRALALANDVCAV